MLTLLVLAVAGGGGNGDPAGWKEMLRDYDGGCK